MFTFAYLHDTKSIEINNYVKLLKHYKMEKNEFLNLSRDDFETYIKDLYSQIWTKEFQLALVAKKDDNLVRLFHYSFPNTFCEDAKKVFFETFSLNIIREIFAFTTFPENNYGKAILSDDEYSKMDLRLYNNNIEKPLKVIAKGEKIELTIEDYYLRGGFFRFREKFPDIAKKLYNGMSKRDFNYMSVINYGTGYVVGLFL